MGETHRTPDGVRAFQCSQCDKAFSNKCTLSTHMKVHKPGYKPPLNDKTRMCDICGKEVKATQFRKHMLRLHSEEHVPCDECDYVATHITLFKLHKKNVHNYITCEQCGKSVPFKDQR